MVGNALAAFSVSRAVIGAGAGFCVDAIAHRMFLLILRRIILYDSIVLISLHACAAAINREPHLFPCSNCNTTQSDFLHVRYVLETFALRNEIRV